MPQARTRARALPPRCRRIYRRWLAAEASRNQT